MLRTALAGLALAVGIPTLPAQSRHAVVAQWTLQEDLRIGGDASGPKSFTEIRGIGATRNGNIFVLEYKEQELRAFSPNGSFITRAARRGEGPGELSNANGLAIGAADAVWVNDPGNHRFVKFGADGRYASQVKADINGFAYVWRGAVLRDGSILDDFGVALRTARTDPRTGRPVFDQRLRVVHVNGATDTLLDADCPPRRSIVDANLVFTTHGGRGQAFVAMPFQAYRARAFTRQGTAWCSPTDEYRILGGELGKSLRDVVIRTDVAPIVVTKAERDSALARVDSFKLKYGPPTSGDVNAMPRTKPLITALFADDAGRAWVQRAGAAGAPVTFDVYDRAGKQVASVLAAGRIGYQVVIANGALLTVITDDDGVPFVVRYRIRNAN